jgi:hypothetical protein
MYHDTWRRYSCHLASLQEGRKIEENKHPRANDHCFCSTWVTNTVGTMGLDLTTDEFITMIMIPCSSAGWTVSFDTCA